MRAWFRAATRPRLLGVFVFLLIAVIVCVRLGAWQWERAQARGEQAAAIEQAERQEAAPVPLDTVTGPQTQILQEMVGTRVVVQGEYRSSDQFFVVAREHDGQVGYWVLAGLELSGGQYDGAIIPVVRGWAPEADPELLQDVPGGTVEVTAYLTPSEGAGARLPEPELMDSVSPAQLVNVWGGPIYSAYLRVIAEDPDSGSGLVPVGPPEIEDAGLNIRNLAYAFEWWVFGGFAVFIWWRLVRDEMRHEREARQAAAGGREPDLESASKPD